MWMRNYRRWLCSITCVLLSCARPLAAIVCTPKGSEIRVHEVTAQYDQNVTLNAEINGQVILAEWKLLNGDPDTGVVRPRQLVIHYGGDLIWSSPDLADRYEALYDKDAQQMSFKLQIPRMTCLERGEFLCSFTTFTGVCSVIFNVTMIVDPFPPFLANKTIEADAGETVALLCEADVGYPAGDIWWYYVPSDGSPARRLNVSSAEIFEYGHCRTFVKSKLVLHVRREDHMAKLRCVTKTVLQRSKDFVEATIYINVKIEPCQISMADCCLFVVEFPTSN